MPNSDPPSDPVTVTFELEVPVTVDPTFFDEESSDADILQTALEIIYSAPAFDWLDSEYFYTVNYPALPRSGLPAPRLLRTGLPVSASELVGTDPTAVPDSAGDFPSRVVRSVPLLPDGHSATIDGARFLSRLNTVEDVVSIVLPPLTARVVNVAENVEMARAGAVSPPCSRLRRSLRKGA